MNSLKIGQYYDEESAEKEFKEFKFNKSKQTMNKMKILQFLKNPEWNKEMEGLVNKTLNLYFEDYIPKYIASFINANINGELTIGIDDFGIIRGIPIKNINENKIKIKIKNMIEKRVKLINKNITHYEIKLILENLNIEFVKLKTSLNDKINNFKTNIDKYFQQFEDIKEELKFIKKREEYWFLKLDKYRSLVNIMTQKYTSKQLYDYIRKNNNNKKSQEILKNYWNICKTFQLPEHDKLQKDKINPNKLMYWLVNFKDLMVFKLNKQKPNFNLKKRQLNQKINKIKKNNPIKLFYQLNPIVNNLILLDVPFYLIKINIKGQNIPFKLLFKDNEDDGWKYKLRINTEYGPCCI